MIPPDMRLQEGKHPSLICILRFHFFLSLSHTGEDEFKMEFKHKELGLGGFGRQTSGSQEESKGLAPEPPSPTFRQGRGPKCGRREEPGLKIKQERQRPCPRALPPTWDPIIKSLAKETYKRFVFVRGKMKFVWQGSCHDPCLAPRRGLALLAKPLGRLGPLIWAWGKQP